MRQRRETKMRRTRLDEPTAHQTGCGGGADPRAGSAPAVQTCRCHGVRRGHCAGGRLVDRPPSCAYLRRTRAARRTGSRLPLPRRRLRALQRRGTGRPCTVAGWSDRRFRHADARHGIRLRDCTDRDAVHVVDSRRPPPARRRHCRCRHRHRRPAEPGQCLHGALDGAALRRRQPHPGSVRCPRGRVYGTVTFLSLTYVSVLTDEGMLKVPNSSLLAAAVGPWDRSAHPHHESEPNGTPVAAGVARRSGMHH